MSESPETAITVALLRGAADFAGVSGLQMAFPNVPYTPPSPSAGAIWLRASILPGQSVETGISLSAHIEHSGILQIDVFATPGAGEPSLIRVASDVIAHFRRGAEMQSDGVTVTVGKSPWRGPIIKDDPWIMTPVSVPYRCFARPIST